MSAIEGIVAADELPSVEEEHAVDLERACERRLGVLLRLRLHPVVGLGGRDLAGVLREVEPDTSRARSADRSSRSR